MVFFHASSHLIAPLSPISSGIGRASRVSLLSGCAGCSRGGRKGRQWHFGMKLHIGVDSQTGLAPSAVVTAANVHDKHPLPELLHGNEQRVDGD